MCLMTNKAEVSYIKCCMFLRDTFPNFVPLEAMCDFELAIKNALEFVYNGIIVRGCYFHHTQVCNYLIKLFEDNIN